MAINSQSLAPAQLSATIAATTRTRPETESTVKAVSGSAGDPAVAAFAALLRVEAEIRSIGRVVDLRHLAVNETRTLLRARQVFIIERGHTGAFKVTAASSLPVVDPTAPTVRWLEYIISRLSASVGLAGPNGFAARAHADAADPLTATYPFQHMHWVPFWSRRPCVTAGFLLVRDAPWQDADRAVSQRLAVTIGHAWALLDCPLPLAQRFRHLHRRWLLGAAVSVLLCGFLPVPMTALAPVEVMARGAVSLAMPMDGQVQDVLVAPSSRVETGAVLVRLVDTHARNKLEIAEREMAVAEARLAKANQLAIADVRGRHELGIARVELALRAAERDYARELFRKLEITASVAGVVLFGDKKDLIGRPLVTGDRLMEIADPRDVELKIEVPVADAVVVMHGARVKVFLDADPLHPVEATVTHFDYQARINEARVAVHRVFATIGPTDLRGHRLGIRGTAQIYGPSTPLGYLLLRRPIAATRQWFGL
jgi:HlyD family secretion protein